MQFRRHGGGVGRQPADGSRQGVTAEPDLLRFGVGDPGNHEQWT